MQALDDIIGPVYHLLSGPQAVHTSLLVVTLIYKASSRFDSKGISDKGSYNRCRPNSSKIRAYAGPVVANMLVIVDI